MASITLASPRCPRSVALALGLFVAACGAPAHPAADAPASTASPGSAPSTDVSGTPGTSGTPGNPAPHAPEADAALPPVDLVQVDPAPPPSRPPSLSIVAPTKGQLLPAAKAAVTPVKLRAAGWSLEGGNHLCVALDRHPCRRVTDLAAPLTLGDLGPTLEDGQHVLTVIARRPSGESVKPAGKGAAFAAVPFFVGKRTPPVWKEGAPILVLSLSDEGPAGEGPLVDVFVANADFAGGSYRLHTSVSGPGLEAGKGESVSDLKPWRLQNARPGQYHVGFSLFRYEADRMKSGAQIEITLAAHAVPGPFSEVARSFRVTK